MAEQHIQEDKSLLSIPSGPDRVLRIPEHALSLPPEVGIALRAALSAANIIRSRLGDNHTIIEKGVGDLVSQVDLDAESELLHVLRNESPNSEVISEETKSLVKLTNRRTWISDPLDATNAFLFRAGPSYPSVMVAMMENRELVLGVVVFPFTGECFYSYKGQGAFKDGVRLVVPQETSLLKDSWIDLNQYGDSALETAEFAQLRSKLRSAHGAKLVTSLVPHSGIALRIIEQQIGLAAVVHDNNSLKVKQAPWDIAAPLAIVKEAGGTFLTLDGSEVDPFFCAPMIVAKSRALAEEIIHLARSEF